MNLIIKLCLISLQITVSTYLFSSSSSINNLVPETNTESTDLGKPYQLPKFPDQNNIFHPKQEPIKQITNLWGYLLSTEPTETSQEHVLRIIRSGQMNDACSLASTSIDTKDPKFLELLPIVISEEFQQLRKNYIEHKNTLLDLLEQNRNKNTQTTSNIHLLLTAIDSNTATQNILSPQKKDLFLQALSKTVEQQEELFGTLTKEHAALVSILEQIKEKLENKNLDLK